jgi:uncharacterized protein (DUF924 family)
MEESWQAVHEFWFPPGLERAPPEEHRDMILRWFGGGMDAALPRFAPLLDAARAGRLEAWKNAARSRLSLILILDQFPRGLFAGTAEAYARDAEALRTAEEGIRAGQYDALDWPWEKLFFYLPLIHAEGPDHLARLDRVVAMADDLARAVAAPLRPLYEFSAGQARGHREVIARFGRFPHRNPFLGRESTPEEAAYLAQGDFVHRRRPPPL